MNEPSRDRTSDEQPVAELVSQLTEQMTQLVRDEVQIARAEFTEKGKHAGRAAAMFGGSALLAFYGGEVLIGSARAGLDRIMPRWGSALLVSGALFGAAGAAAAAGWRELEQVTPVVPDALATNLSRDVETIKENAQR